MKISHKIFLLSSLLMYTLTITAYGRENMENIVFATFAQDESELEQALVLAKSLRSFGGDMKDAPFWLYLPPNHPNWRGRSAIGQRR